MSPRVSLPYCRRATLVVIAAGAVVLTLVGASAEPATAAHRPAAHTARGHAGRPRPTRFLVDPHSRASSHATDHGAAGIVAHEISRVPQAIWLTDDHLGGVPLVADLAAARRQHRVPVLVAYDIPRRDCSSYSGGGASTAGAYRAFIRRIARAVGRQQVDLVLEPDALASMSSCLAPAQQAQREALLRFAVGTLRHDRQARVYLDAGHSGWVAAGTMAVLLRRSGVAQARGFSLDIANFDRTSTEQRYGDTLSRLLRDKHYVIDTSRNGRGPDAAHDWCNPGGRALGHLPTARTGNRRNDALLWIKHPGESDGGCAPGQPAAGSWYAAYAIMLARNAGWRI